MSDPLTMVYQTLWRLAEESPNFNRIVRLGNRVDFTTSDRDPMQERPNAADLPEVVLVFLGSTGNIHSNSSTSMLIAQYAWQISTGDFRLNQRALPVMFELFRAMANWQAHLGQLEWSDEKGFVKEANVLDATAGLSDPEQNRGIKGWSVIWSCEVHMHFATKTLIGEL